MSASSDETLWIFHLRPARRRARSVAMMEALCLLRDLRATVVPGGPLGDQAGVFWIALPETARGPALARLPRLGYSTAVDGLEAVGGAGAVSRAGARGSRSGGAVLRWRGSAYRRVRLYEEDAAAARESAPDRRVFLFEDRTGSVRPVQGYRGDGAPTSRRGLPVCDARLLVNLVVGGERVSFLEPFAGAGGLVREALAAGARVTSVDIDPTLRHGLVALGAWHCVGDVRQLPFRAAAFDAIATEPPYHPEATPVVCEGLRELARVLRPGGRIATLCAAAQAAALRREAAALDLHSFLDAPIDRKGLGVVVLAWERADA